MDDKTIPQILESVAEEICQNYCKWPDQWDEEEKGELSESDICANLPAESAALMEMLINGVVVKAYADNDGGLWYYDPVTGRTETVNEQSDDDIRLHEAEFP